MDASFSHNSICPVYMIRIIYTYSPFDFNKSPDFFVQINIFINAC